MKLIKLTKAEREAIASDLLDWALDYSDPEDVKAELRAILKKGLPKEFIPYLKLDDEALLQKLAQYVEPTQAKDWVFALEGYFKPNRALKVLKATKEYYE